MRKLNEEKLEKLPTFNQQLNDECGRQGTPARDEFHEEALSWYYGQILRSRRQELRMTQKQLADKLGREQSYIARVERGKVDVQLSSFLRIAAATMFARSEGIIPAPESSHAIAAAIREAKKAKEAGESKVILFNLSGHGLIDMSAYDQYIAGDLANYQLSDEMVRQNTKDLEKII